MALRATLSVFFGCNFGQASKLLAAAECGDDRVVQQVRPRPHNKVDTTKRVSGLGIALRRQRHQLHGIWLRSFRALPHGA